VTRRPFTRIHFSETRWTYTEPDAIYLEVAGYFVSIIEYNIAPLYTAIEEHRLLRIRAHPEFANSADHAQDSFATQIRFSNLPTVRSKTKEKKAPELELEMG